MEKTKNKSKALLSAILSIVICLSIVAGATYALFTSESKLNVAVTSGKVNVVATTENLEVFSGQWNNSTANYEDILSTTAYNDAAGSGYYFANGGFAALSSTENTLTIDRVTPMDKVVFDIRIKNNSNVAVQYRTVINVNEDNGLFQGLDITFEQGENAPIFGSNAAYSHWARLETNSADIVVPVTVLLPMGAGNEFQDKACSLAYMVEAVQGNAQVTDDANFIVRPKTIATLLTETAVQDTEVVMADAKNGVSATIPANAIADSTPIKLSISTTEVKAHSVTYEISLTNDKTESITLTSQATIDLNIGKSLKNIHVNHSGVAMQVDDFAYNAATGVLTIKTTSFSPFEVFFESDNALYAVSNGTNAYANLADAVAAATSGDVLMMLRNITEFKTSDIVTIPDGLTLTLNMNGKKIITASDFIGRPIVNLGTLSVTGNGTIDSSASLTGSGAIRNDGNGVLTIQNGVFAGNVQGDGAAIRNAAICTINGGDFTATSAVYNDPIGTLTINNGNFHSTSCSSCGKWAYTVNNHGNLIFNNGTVTGVQGALAIGGGSGVVNAGTFKTVACSKHSTGNTAFYPIYIAGETGAATATINGGTYISASKQAIWVGNDNTNGDGGINEKATVEINGGTFISPNGVNVMQTGPVTGTPKIMGGIFSNNNVTRQNATPLTLDSYLDTKYEVVLAPESGFGWYKVALKSIEA